MDRLIENRKVSKRLQIFKKELRKKATPAELAFKKILRGHKLKYQFQRPFYRSAEFSCIADFFFKSDKAKIVVEIDGGYHASVEQQRKDDYRSSWLVEKRGCKIIRFTNEEVINGPDACLKKLAEFYIEVVGQIPAPSDNYNILLNLTNSNE